MKFPFVSRRLLEETESRSQELKQEFCAYRRRNAEVREDAYLQGSSDALKELLPVYDNLLRALEQPCADEAFLKGIRLTLDSMKNTLATLGVTEIPALGQSFDPQLHEAMEHIQDQSLGESQVARVVLTGFRRGNTVLRHALVVVAN